MLPLFSSEVLTYTSFWKCLRLYIEKKSLKKKRGEKKGSKSCWRKRVKVWKLEKWVRCEVNELQVFLSSIRKSVYSENLIFHLFRSVDLWNEKRRNERWKFHFSRPVYKKSSTLFAYLLGAGGKFTIWTRGMENFLIRNTLMGYISRVFFCFLVRISKEWGNRVKVSPN